MNRMMPTVVRAALRQPGARLVVAAVGCGPGLLAALAATGHAVSPVRPDEFPLDTHPDVVACPHEEKALADARVVSQSFHAPVVCVWEAPPDPAWPPGLLAHARACRGGVDVFPSAALAAAWGGGGEVAEGLAPGPLGAALGRAARTVFLLGGAA